MIKRRKLGDVAHDAFNEWKKQITKNEALY
jgi:hypothetical protein